MRWLNWAGNRLNISVYSFCIDLLTFSQNSDIQTVFSDMTDSFCCLKHTIHRLSMNKIDLKNSDSDSGIDSTTTTSV